MAIVQSAPTRSHRVSIERVSLVLAPLLMATGDLLHPDESMDPASQAAIVLDHPSRWYAAHLLLFVGLLLFIPGILALTRLASERKPSWGYAGRALMLTGAAALAAVIAIEMVVGRFVSEGTDPGDATALVRTFQSGSVLGVILPGVLLFFVGSAAAIVPLATTRDRFRSPALVLALGLLFILVEVLSAQVLLSQIGNIVVLGASVRIGSLIKQGDQVDGSP